MVRARRRRRLRRAEHDVLDGRTVARLCTINPRTTKHDIERTIERLEQPLALRHLNTRDVAALCPI